MSHFHDLSPNSAFDRWQEILVSVGWLDNSHRFSRAAVPLNFFRALVRLLQNPWQPGVFAGRAPCSMCQFSGGPGTLVFEGDTVLLGSANLFVPGRQSKVFVSPSLIAHYIDAHGYAPPEEFQEAVLECPPMGSFPYRKALHERGVRAGSAI